MDRDGGVIGRIREGKFSPRDVVACAVRALIDQYLDAIRLIDPKGETGEIVVLAGGIGRRLPAFTRVLAARAGRRLTVASAGEETLAGLIRIVETGDRQARGENA
jgi:hypothetical protein